MISSLLYTQQKKELDNLLLQQKEMAAKLTEEKWNFHKCQSLEEVQEQIADKPLLDMISYGIEGETEIDCLEKLRKEYKQSALLLLADATLSPMTYLRPQIMASGLLLRPWTPEQAQNVLKDILENYFEEQLQSEETFQVENKDGRTNIPMRQICYFEAREKKIFVNTGTEEYGFNKTLDALEQELEMPFVRCHRSFIVNTSKIQKIQYSQNLILLKDDIMVPLARSYKSVMKELM